MLIGCNMKIKETKMIVIMIYVLLLVFYGLCGSYPKAFMIYPDEIRYIDLPRSILADGSFIIQNTYLPYQKLFYSLCLFPCFFIKNTYWQIVCINWLNALWMASTIIPAYLFSKNLDGEFIIFNRTIKKDRLFLILVAILPIYVNSQFMMSEVVFFPLCMWILWFIYKNIWEKDNKILLSNIVLGFLFYLAYFCKEIALYFPIGYAVLIFYDLIKKKIKRKRMLRVIACILSFGITFIITKLTVFSGMGNSYNQQDLESVFSFSQIMYMCYAFIYMLIFTILAFGVIPVFIPIMNYKNMDEKDKKLYLMINAIIIVAAAVIAYTISVREDYMSRAPKVIIRYMEVFIIPYIYLLIKYFDLNEVTNKWYKRSVIAYLLVFIIVGYTNDSRLTDNMMLRYYYLFNESFETLVNRMVTSVQISSLIYEIGYLLIRLGIAYIFYRILLFTISDMKKARNVIIMALLLVSVIGIAGTLPISFMKYKVPSYMAMQMSDFNEELKEKEYYNSKEIMIIAEDEMTKRIADTYLDARVYVVDKDMKSIFISNSLNENDMDITIRIKSNLDRLEYK